MRWQHLIAALGLGMLGGTGWMLWQQHYSQPEPAATAAAPQPVGYIPLMVRHDGAALRLQWNPRLDAIRNAASGTLIITDGAHHSTLNLDGPELRAGLASYWPEGRRVGFRLETDGGASGSLEVAADPRPEPAPAPVAPAVTAKTQPPPRRPRRPESDPPPPATYHRWLPLPDKSDRSPSPALDDGLEWTAEPRPSPFGDGDRAAPSEERAAPHYSPRPARKVPRAQFRPESPPAPRSANRQAGRPERRPESRWSRLKHKLSFLRRP